MLYITLLNYYREVCDYLFRKKYTLNRFLQLLPLNFYSFQDEYSLLLSQLNCLALTEFLFSTRNVFRCTTTNNTWYIKIPANEESTGRRNIKEVVGAAFYSELLDEDIVQFSYHNNSKTILSRELENFYPFFYYFDRILFFNQTSEKFVELLLFNGNECLSKDSLEYYRVDFFSLLFGKNISYMESLIFFITSGMQNFATFILRISFEWHLRYMDAMGNLDAKLKYKKCTDNITIENFELTMLASYLMHNSDLHSRNLGLMKSGNSYKVMAIDYDRLGTYCVSDRNTVKDIAKFAESSHMALWSQNPSLMLSAIETLLNRTKKIDSRVLADKIIRSLPGVSDESITEELFSIFQFKYVKDIKPSITMQIDTIVRELIVRDLHQIQSSFVAEIQSKIEHSALLDDYASKQLLKDEPHIGDAKFTEDALQN